MRKTRNRVVLVTAGVASAMLALAGCADSPAPAGSESGGAVETPPDIVIGGPTTLSYIIPYLADSLGYYADAGEELGGISVTKTEFSSQNDASAALAAGQLSFDIDTAATTIQGSINDLDFVGVQSLSSGGLGCLVVKDSIKSPKDLAGKTIAVTSLSAATYGLVLKSLAYDDIDPAGIKFATIGPQSGFLGALQAGQIDGMAPGEPGCQQAVDAGVGHVMYNFYDPDFVEKIMGGPLVTSILMTTKAYAERYPQAVQAIVDANLKAAQWLSDNKDDPDLVLSKLPDAFQTLGPIFPDLLERLAEGMTTTGEMSDEAWTHAVDLATTLGSIPADQDIDVSTLFDEQFVMASQG